MSGPGGRHLVVAGGGGGEFAQEPVVGGDGDGSFYLASVVEELVDQSWGRFNRCRRDRGGGVVAEVAYLVGEELGGEGSGDCLRSLCFDFKRVKKDFIVGGY